MPTLRLLMAGLILTVLALPVAAAAQSDPGRYYSETGHTLDARFMAFFDGHGGQTVLGFPITDSFIDPLSGWTVQYLENARLELTSGQGGGFVGVRLSALGEALGGWDPGLAADEIPATADSTCRYFPESGHAVCHVFLDYFLANGGPALFGYPISEFKLEGERIVQYFQAFRLDWYPEAVEGTQVRPAPLGRQHFDLMGYDPELLRPQLPSDMMLYEVLELRPGVSVRHPILGPEAGQEVYVTVHDQNLNPVPGATVVLTVHLADADRILLMPPTDGRGVSRIAFAFEGQPPGLTVTLDVTAVLGQLQALTRDSFLVWY